MSWYIYFEGLDASTQSSTKQSQTVNNAMEISQNQNVDTPQQGHWGENRLADVVKGTAKLKGSGSSKESSSAGDNDSPRDISPQNYSLCNQASRQNSLAGPPECKDASTESGDIPYCTVTLTPPSSPEKWVILYQSIVSNYYASMTEVLYTG